MPVISTLLYSKYIQGIRYAADSTRDPSSGTHEGARDEVAGESAEEARNRLRYAGLYCRGRREVSRAQDVMRLEVLAAGSSGLDALPQAWVQPICS